jgi:hypothetical protein
MALPASNLTFDVYRGYNPTNPYAPPNTPAARQGLQGYLRNHVRNGRFGYRPQAGNANIYWTNVLMVPITDDLRDAYNAELNNFAPANGDTVMAADYPVTGTCCAFCVVMVQRVNRGGPNEYFRIYLDRARPTYGSPCIDPTAGGQSCTCCPSTSLPNTLVVTLTNVSGCGCLAGTYTLAWTPGQNQWTFFGTGCGGQALTIHLKQDATFGVTCGNEGLQFTLASFTCSPFVLNYSQNSPATVCCSGAVTAVVTA